jgi:SPP1 family predicted phage head-tail adaptor
MNSASFLNRRIRLVQPNDTSDGQLGKRAGWTTVPGCDSVPANIKYPPPAKKGDEEYKQGQLHSAVFATITMRHRPTTNISPAMRVIYGTRTFEIRTVLLVDEARRWVTLQCEERFAGGTQHQ